MKQPNYKFNEGVLIKELQTYIDATYKSHYGQGKIQTSEVIIDRGNGLGFFLGNIDKYNSRYGNKGNTSDHRTQLKSFANYNARL